MPRKNPELQRRRLRTRLNYYKDTSFLEGTIQEIISTLLNLEQEIKHVFQDQQEIEIELGYDYHYGSGDRSTEVIFWGHRDETDEEFTARLKKIKQQQEAAREAALRREELKKDKEYQAYIKLKEKFES